MAAHHWESERQVNVEIRVLECFMRAGDVLPSTMMNAAVLSMVKYLTCVHLQRDKGRYGSV